MFYSLFRLWFSTKVNIWEEITSYSDSARNKYSAGSDWAVLARLCDLVEHDCPAVCSPEWKSTWTFYVTGRAHQLHKSVTGTRHHQGMAHAKWHLSPFSSYITLLVYFITLQAYHPYLYPPLRNSICGLFWGPLSYNNIIWICLLLTVSSSGKHCWVWVISLLLHFSGSICFLKAFYIYCWIKYLQFEK